MRAFTGRPAAIGDHIAGHAVNPALQPVLSRIPALSLAESYARGEGYEYGKAFRSAAGVVAGEELSAVLERHIGFFQDVGLDWLAGDYRITAEMIEAS